MHGMPATFVGAPAVIASTTACCVVVAALEHADGPAEPQHGDPVGGLEDVVEVVRDQDDAEALLAEAAHEREHLLGLRDAERRGRLVEDDELRVPHAPRARRRPTGAGRPRASRPAGGST